MSATLNLSEDAIKKIAANLFEKSKMDWRFYLLLILSTIIVTLGLLLNNASIIIGGMLVTPLLTPILAFAFGIVILNSHVLWRSAKILIKSILIIFIFSFITTLLAPAADVQSEIISRTFINLSFFYVALAAGIAAAFAWARPDLSESLPGIAISVALLPPLATAGIGLALWQNTLTFGGIKLFASNIIGIIIAAAFVFAIMGLHKAKNIALQKVEEEEKDAIKKELEKVKKEENLIKEVKKEVDGDPNIEHRSDQDNITK